MNVPRLHAVRRIVMAAGIYALAATPMTCPTLAGAQNDGGAAPAPIIVFTPQDAGRSASQEPPAADQAATLETIRTDPAASDIRIGRSAAAAIAAVPATRALSLAVPAASATSGSAAYTLMSFTGVDVAHNAEEMVSFHARDEAADAEVSLVVQGVDVLGSLRLGDDVYKVHPLGGGLTAVYRYDTSRLRRHPPGWGAMMRRRPPPPKAPAREQGAAADTGDVIDLMVAYTPAARTAAGNIDTFIQFAIDNTHRIYRNSNIGFRLRLVHKHQVSYTEASRMGTDLDRLTFTGDGVMEEVHGLRDRHGADLVALIVGRSSDGVCGVAWVPDFGAAPTLDWSGQGFSVTAHNCETSDMHTFAHELGHNQGANHDPDNSCEDGIPPCSLPPPPTFPYRYGRCNTAEGWNTTMSYRRSTRGECRREIEYFSSPVLRYNGTPTGDTARRDNRRVLLETARIVANYRPSGGIGHVLPYVLAERTAGRHGFVRIVNRSAEAGAVTLTAIDDAGRTAGTETLDLPANGAVHFNSRDLERGNAAMGLTGVGAGTGDWRLVLNSALDVQPLAYVRTTDGFVTRIDDVEAESEDAEYVYTVHFFNPARNRNQRSFLRLINPGSTGAGITIEAHDDAGARRGPVNFELPAGQARRLTVGELEAGSEEFFGRLGTGSGKWRLTVTATGPVQVMSLLQTPTGHLTNLSGVPAPSTAAVQGAAVGGGLAPGIKRRAPRAVRPGPRRSAP